MAEEKFSNIDKEIIWINYFGGALSGADAFGRWVYKFNFECHYIFPKKLGGKTDIKNAIPLHPTSHYDKLDALTGIINGKKFKVKEKDFIGILYIEGKKINKI